MESNIVIWWSIPLAAVLGFAFGAAYYGVLGRRWMAALGKTEDEVKPEASQFVIAFIAELIMAVIVAYMAVYVLNDPISPFAGAGVAALLWLGLVATTIMVNHRYGGQSWNLTIIDAGHWFGVLIVMGLVVGLVH